MERIKEAIAKARREQTHTINDAMEPEKLVSPPLPSTSDESLVDAEKINYARTISVQLDPAHLEKHRIVASSKNDPTSWCFDLLRTQVLQKMEENGWRTLAVVSPTPEAGKTVVAINLAISIAQQPNRTAMLVDFDLRRPRLGAYLGLPMDKSLNDLLEGKAELAQLMVNPGIPGLVVLPTQRTVPKSAETLSSRKIENLIKELRDRYESRIVIFDLPPILSADDAIAVLPQMDCVLIVIGNGMSTQAEIEETMHLLPTANVLGVVLNKAEMEPRSNYY